MRAFSRSTKTLLLPVVVLLCLVATLVTVSASQESAVAQAVVPPSRVAPVNAQYQGLKLYNHLTGDSPPDMYDAWTYGDLVLYTPPNYGVTQAMVNQWMGWYSHVDQMSRRITPGTDADFERRFRTTDPHFGPNKKMIAFSEKGVCDCGNKIRAELGAGRLLGMVAEPDNYSLHHIVFYEMHRGGIDEAFDLRATWPRLQYILPHLMALMAEFEIGGIEALEAQNDVSGAIYVAGLNEWEAYDKTWLETWPEVDVFPNYPLYPDTGNTIFPIQATVLFVIGPEIGIDGLASILDNLTRTRFARDYANATDSICDFQQAVNLATNNRYANRMVDDWRFPRCEPRPSVSTVVDDIQFAVNRLCVSADYYYPWDGSQGTQPRDFYLAQTFCDGTGSQRFTQVPVEGGFALRDATHGNCLENGRGTGIAQSRRCDPTGSASQTWNVNGSMIQHVDTGLCLTAENIAMQHGGYVLLEQCTNAPNQQIIDSSALPPPLMGDLMQLKIAGSGKCVDSPAGANNSAVFQSACTDSTSQQFLKVPGNGGFMLQFAHSSKCLNVWEGEITQWDCGGVDHQLFTWNAGRLQVKSSGECLQVAFNSADEGRSIQPSPCTASTFQQVGLPADADCDGLVDTADALAIVQYEAGLRQGNETCAPGSGPNIVNLTNADADGNGTANVADALFIAQLEAGN